MLNRLSARAIQPPNNLGQPHVNDLSVTESNGRARLQWTVHPAAAGLVSEECTLTNGLTVYLVLDAYRHLELVCKTLRPLPEYFIHMQVPELEVEADVGGSQDLDRCCHYLMARPLPAAAGDQALHICVDFALN